ncbi:hypothetical protein M409DRAFT_29767 [Zasmidium cellare ATCC 36951]|uniref:AB hydrolase-1 domain-containing protein n=1 Tax=Zasmidium cellare ATCC 36951 TaxID=1080233 RepID=A0A6A6BY81_ZASCE|nr:uncharacterized protein M409DRAFT_29767 [Zasmidium cellare ATCC 36951]KAF2159764.1 hypothetical protein M409DRAFT_29767 [Zasmidium cellare ATCC 36951]
MQPFELALPEGRKTTGLIHFPAQSSRKRISTPSIVTLHGGTYTASYFNVDDEHSIGNIAKALGAPVVCVTRPGYGDSSVQPRDSDETWIHQQGRFFHETILPAIWQEYGGAKTNSTSIVLLGHSVGGGVVIATAARYSTENSPKYPLSGLVTSGISSTVSKALAQQQEPGGNVEEAQKVENKSTQNDGTFLWPIAMKDQLLLCSNMNLCSPSILEASESLNAPIPAPETLDVQKQWFEYWRELAAEVKVPHMNTMPEYDWLWEVNREIMEDFGRAFESCPRMEISILPEAPHCIELSRQSEAWYFRSFGFAMECAGAFDLKKGRSGQVSK